MQKQSGVISLRQIITSGLSAALAAALVILPAVSRADRQEQDKDKKPSQPQTSEKDGKVPNEKEAAKSRKKLEEGKDKGPTYTPAEVVAETVIYAYGTRDVLQKARASIEEQGNIRLATDQGDITGTSLMRSVRKDKSWEDLLRVDLDLTPPEAARQQGAPASIKYVAAFNGGSMWSAQNGQYVNPRPEVQAAFLAQLTHDYTTLLRYKEDGSKLELIGPETVLGIATNVLELTNPRGEKTKFWVSAKSYRILHLEYELKQAADQPATKFRISYYYTPVKVVQNTLVPTRRVVMQDGKFVQEITVTALNYTAKHAPEVFQHLQEQ